MPSSVYSGGGIGPAQSDANYGLLAAARALLSGERGRLPLMRRRIRRGPFTSAKGSVFMSLQRVLTQRSGGAALGKPIALQYSHNL